MSNLLYLPEDWDNIFKAERDNLRFVLPEFKFNIEHIGATSINNCRSFRNVDILISLSHFNDIYTAAMLLNSRGYKMLNAQCRSDCALLIKRSKYKKIGVTIRIVEYGGDFYNRCKAFQVVLRESYDRTQMYNNFREKLFAKYPKNIKRYNEVKYDYINSQLDYYFKFQ